MRAGPTLALIAATAVAGAHARDLTQAEARGCAEFGALTQQIAADGERGATYDEQMRRLRSRVAAPRMPAVKAALDMLYGRGQRYYPSAPPDAVGQMFRQLCAQQITNE